MKFDVVSLGELLVEFEKRQRDSPHYELGEYIGPFPSGAPAITIDSAARMGLRAGFIGVVGDDDFGRVILDRFKRDGVDVSRIRVDKDHLTGIAFVTYFNDGSRRFVFHFRYSASAQLSEKDVDEEYIASTRVLYISGSSLSLGEGVRRACYKAVEIAYRNWIPIVFDPNIRPELISRDEALELMGPVIRRSLIVSLGLDELLFLTGADNIRRASEILFKEGPQIVVIKMGPRGAMLITKKGDKLVFPSFRVNEVDPTGAGDVFNAGIIYGFINEWSYEDTLRFANAAAAIKVTRRGPMEGPSSLNDVVELMKKGDLNLVNEHQLPW